MVVGGGERQVGWGACTRMFRIHVWQAVSLSIEVVVLRLRPRLRLLGDRCCKAVLEEGGTGQIYRQEGGKGSQLKDE